MDLAKELPTSILSKLHFIKLEIDASDTDSIKYKLKNHFNTVVLEIDGKFSEDSGSINFQAISPHPRNQTQSSGTSSTVFFITIHKPTRDSDDVYTDCQLATTTGQTLGSIVVQGTGLSTYNYDILDTDRKSLFQVERKRIGLGQQIEFSIKTKQQDILVARVNIHNNKVFLSMPPELDSLTKTRLISLMILADIVENEQDGCECDYDDYNNSPTTSTVSGETTRSHAQHLLIA